VVISFIDLRHKIIPDVVSLPGIAVGLAVSFLPGPISWVDSLIGILCGGGILFLIAVIYERITGKEGMGGGDVKLLAMIGGWMGWQSLPLIILISSLTGTVMGGGAMLLARKGYRARIPFGPFLSLGALICFFFGPQIIHWYVKML
jgi:leader peptidase (prepilin peptidase)/N-methyltransferase